MTNVLNNKADSSRVNELAINIQQTELERQQSKREVEDAGYKHVNVLESGIREELARVNQAAMEVQELRR